MKLHDIFELMIARNASDAILRPQSELRLRIFTELKVEKDIVPSEDDIKKAISQVLTQNEQRTFEQKKGYDTAVNYKDKWRFRLGIFYQQGSPAIVARKIDLQTLSFKALNLPGDVLENLCHERRGLVLLVGLNGSGKSTTIASMLEYINQNLGRHILTIEEPIEYIFKDKKSFINQREIGRDVTDHDEALKQMATLSPDVLYIGDIKNFQICNAVLKAAEKGMLVISTLHSLNAQMAVEALVGMFPAEQQERVFSRLSMFLKGVIAERLIPRADKAGLIPAYEVMTLSPSISKAIEEKRISEIPKIIKEGSDLFGMNTYNQCLVRLLGSGVITQNDALEYSDNRKDIEVGLKFRDS